MSLCVHERQKRGGVGGNKSPKGRPFIGVGGGRAGGGTMPPPPKKKMEARNSGKMQEKFGQKVEGKIKKRQNKDSGKLNGKERKIGCIISQ